MPDAEEQVELGAPAHQPQHRKSVLNGRIGEPRAQNADDAHHTDNEKLMIDGGAQGVVEPLRQGHRRGCRALHRPGDVTHEVAELEPCPNNEPHGKTRDGRQSRMTRRIGLDAPDGHRGKDRCQQKDGLPECLRLMHTHQCQARHQPPEQDRNCEGQPDHGVTPAAATSSESACSRISANSRRLSTPKASSAIQ